MGPLEDLQGLLDLPTPAAEDPIMREAVMTGMALDGLLYMCAAAEGEIRDPINGLAMILEALEGFDLDKITDEGRHRIEATIDLLEKAIGGLSAMAGD